MILRFVHIPKTAGVSILEALEKSISSIVSKQLSDCTQKIDEGKESWEIRGANGSYHSKASEPSVRVAEAKDMTNGGVIQESAIDFSFSFIRNPWDRFVSAYAYLNEKKNEEYEEYIKPFKTFKDFALNGSTESLHFKPQTYWIDQQVDFVGRFEKIQSHFDGLCKKLSLGPCKLEKRNETKHKPYWDYYDAESRKAVLEKYKEDAELLGYSFTDYKHPKRT